MSPELLKTISNIFLIAGILFMALTIFLSFKFRLVSIIKTEINNHKEKNKGDLSIEPMARNNNTPRESAKTDIPQTVTMPEEKHENMGYTVIVPQRRNEEIPAENMGTVVVMSETGRQPKKYDDFIISENIIIIHGNPSAIHSR